MADKVTETNLQFPIPNAVIEPYIRAAVSAAISASLGGGEKMIEAAVAATLAQKVNHEGKIGTYASDNKYILAEVLASNKIREIARQTINEMAEQMRPKIKESIERQLKTKHSAIAKALVDGLIGSLSSSWNVRVDLRTDGSNG